MKSHSFFLVENLLQNEIISREEVDIYQFGIECLVLKIVNYLSYVVIGVLMKMPFELLVMGCFLIPMRRSAGGYHAKTKIGCYIFSCVAVILALLVCRVLSMHFVWYIMLFFANLLIIFLAPVDNKNKTMDYAERHYFRKKTMKVLLITNLACYFGILVERERLYGPIIMGVCVVALLVTLGEIKGIYNKKQITGN